MPDVQDLVEPDMACLELLDHLAANRTRVFEELDLLRHQLKRIRLPATDTISYAYETCASSVFNDRLTRVGLATADMPPTTSGRVALDVRGTRGLAICLNARLASPLCADDAPATAAPAAHGQGPDALVALLLHHLIHAWFAARTARAPQDLRRREVAGHGAHFAAALHAVRDAVSRGGGLGGASSPPLPLCFGFPPAVLAARGWWPRRVAGALAHREPPRGCRPEVDEVAAHETRRWVRDLEARVRPRMLLRHGGGGGDAVAARAARESVHVVPTGAGVGVGAAAGGHVFVSWRAQHYALPRAALLAHLPAVAARLGDGEGAGDGVPRLAVPGGVPAWLLAELLAFAASGRYGPPLDCARTRHGAAPPVVRFCADHECASGRDGCDGCCGGSSSNGGGGEWPALLRTDLLMHKLGAALAAPELQHAVRTRLDRQHITLEDPRTVLDAAAVTYFAPSPPSSSPAAGDGAGGAAAMSDAEREDAAAPAELLRWLTAWLARLDDEASPPTAEHGAAAGSAVRRSNWWALHARSAAAGAEREGESVLCAFLRSARGRPRVRAAVLDAFVLVLEAEERGARRAREWAAASASSSPGGPAGAQRAVVTAGVASVLDGVGRRRQHDRQCLQDHQHPQDRPRSVHVALNAPPGALPRVEELFCMREVACHSGGEDRRGGERVRLAWGPVERTGDGPWEVRVLGFPLKAVFRRGVWVPVMS
jgi:hypothetical protein